MKGNEQDVIDGLKLEYEQANAAPSASIGMTPLQLHSALPLSAEDTAAQEEQAVEPAGAAQISEQQLHSLQ